MLQKSISRPLPSKTGQPYPASGLYLNDGSSIPLWTINFYEERKGIFLTADGAYMARTGNMANVKEKSIHFYEAGQLKRSYSVEELIPSIEQIVNSLGGRFFPVSSSSRRRWTSNIFLDSKKKTLRIHFVTGNKFVFDLTTGAIVSQ